MERSWGYRLGGSLGRAEPKGEWERIAVVSAQPESKAFPESSFEFHTELSQAE